MISPIISSIETKRRSKIYVGRNALFHALYFITYNRDCRDDSELYDLNKKIQLDKSVCWGLRKADTAITASSTVLGNGVHAKMYEYRSHIILSSQNNGSSPLFEFAVVYLPEKSSKLETFLGKAMWQAGKFSEWFAKTKDYKIRIS
jgi:hypothetical protein